MEKYAKQIVRVFMDRRVNRQTMRMLAFWVVHEAGPALDEILLFCRHIEREARHYQERIDEDYS